MQYKGWLANNRLPFNYSCFCTQSKTCNEWGMTWFELAYIKLLSTNMYSTWTWPDHQEKWYTDIATHDNTELVIHMYTFHPLCVWLTTLWQSTCTCTFFFSFIYFCTFVYVWYNGDIRIHLKTRLRSYTAMWPIGSVTLWAYHKLLTRINYIYKMCGRAQR